MERKNYCPYCMTPVSENESCPVCGLTAGTYIPSPHHLPPGTVLMDRYLVGRVLGEGGFGITYIGCDLRLELKVAIKEYYPVDRATRNASASLEVTNFIGPSAKSYERGKHKFLSEAQVMARLDKQHVIVSVRDFFEINNTAYIVMEYIEGITFHELVEKKGGRIPPEELFPMIEPLFHALSIIHENGLIHRDISPDNLMLENGRIRLLDFGCAREAARGTETMTIALKHGYAPIEQYQQKGQGPWTDIYALSATIYYCLTGKVPPQALDRITEDELLLPGKLGVNLSSEQEKALLKGMKLQPSRRFSSAEEMWRAIYTQPSQEERIQLETNVEQDSNEKNRQTQPFTENAQEGDAYVSDHAAYSVVGENKSVDERNAHRYIGVEQSADENINQCGKQCESESFKELTNENADFDHAAINTVVPATEMHTKDTIEDTSVDSGIHIDQKKKLYYGVGIAAACVFVLIIIVLIRIPTKKKDTVEISKTDIVANIADPAESSSAQESEVSEDAAAAVSDQQRFDNAFRFTSGDCHEFEALMADNSVEAVIIDCGDMYGGYCDITKPVLLSETSRWQADSLTILEEGYLQVEGTLDLHTGGYLRLCGNTLRLYIADNGTFFADSTFVWMDDEICLEMADGNELQRTANQIVFSEEVFESGDVRSVTDFASLKRAADWGKPVSIDADITLEDDVNFSAPVRIAKGVTVNTIRGERSYGFAFNAGSVLRNDGVLEGQLRLYDGSAVINHGTLSMQEPKSETSYPSLWVESASTVVNFGTINADDVSRFWKDTLFVNMGELNCFDFILIGGDMANLGTVMVSEEYSCFEITNASRLWNKDSGTITVKNAATLYNSSWVDNMGEILVEHGATFHNIVLNNNGSFRAESGASLDIDNRGIYCGGGLYEVGNTDIKVYNTSYEALDVQEHQADVVDEAGFMAALETRDINAVCVKADITVSSDIVMRKPLIIDQGCSLTMADGATLLDYGNSILLQENAVLKGSNITLQEDAMIYMVNGSGLIVEETGSLTMDSSLLCGWDSDIQMDKASFVLKNKAGMALENVNSLSMIESEVTLQDQSVLVLPMDHGEVDFDGSVITLAQEKARSYFYVISDIDLQDCTLQIDKGVFWNSASSPFLSNCDITIGREGEWISHLSNLSLLSGTTMHNEGLFVAEGWHEHLFTFHGNMTNLGTMEFGVDLELSQPIDNQGIVQYYGQRYREDGRGWSDADVIGNKPIDMSIQ